MTKTFRMANSASLFLQNLQFFDFFFSFHLHFWILFDVEKPRDFFSSAIVSLGAIASLGTFLQGAIVSLGARNCLRKESPNFKRKLPAAKFKRKFACMRALFNDEAQWPPLCHLSSKTGCALGSMRHSPKNPVILFECTNCDASPKNMSTF